MERSPLRIVGRIPASTTPEPDRPAQARATVEELVELSLHPAQAVAGEHLRIEVELEVERPDLGGEVAVGDRGQHRHRAGRRLPRPVDEEHLLLRPDARDAGLEHVLGEHVLERLQVAQHPADRGLPIGRPLRGLRAHRVRPAPPGTAAASPATAASRAPTADPTDRPGWGCPSEPRAWATAHDSPMSSLAPSPLASTTNRRRSVVERRAVELRPRSAAPTPA